jgi:hypothetical protein
VAAWTWTPVTATSIAAIRVPMWIFIFTPPARLIAPGDFGRTEILIPYNAVASHTRLDQAI